MGHIIVLIPQNSDTIVLFPQNNESQYSSLPAQIKSSEERQETHTHAVYVDVDKNRTVRVCGTEVITKSINKYLQKLIGRGGNGTSEP